MPTTRKPTRAQLDKLSERYLEIATILETLEAEKDQIKEILVENLGVGDHLTSSGKEFSISTFNRLNAGRVQAAYPVEKFPDFYKVALDVPSVREHVAAVDLVQYEDTSYRLAPKKPRKR